MDKIRIIGGTPLRGRIPISGSKNAALPLMAASLLTAQPVTLSNIPYLADVVTMAKLLVQHGVSLHMTDERESGHHYGREICLQAERITNLTAPYDLVRTMRASVLVLGPLLARFGEVKVSLPGGCAIGTRPIDLHLKALEQMGAQIDLQEGYILARAPGGLKGAEIHFDKVSVGATENILMAAALAGGQTVLHNAAREPEVTDLAQMLVAMGAQIEGVGTDRLTIHGVSSLNGVNYRVIPDRIETASYLAAAIATHGEVELTGVVPEHIHAISEKLHEAGAQIELGERTIRYQNGKEQLRGVDVTTQPYPAFPTDMQAQMIALMATAQGASSITETIFENRYMHVPELMRMGANITLRGQTALVRGVTRLRGANVMATDLRASVSLVIAALAAEGETVIHRVYHLDRGYERLEEKLAACGAKVERIR